MEPYLNEMLPSWGAPLIEVRPWDGCSLQALHSRKICSRHEASALAACSYRAQLEPISEAWVSGGVLAVVKEFQIVDVFAGNTSSCLVSCWPRNGGAEQRKAAPHLPEVEACHRQVPSIAEVTAAKTMHAVHCGTLEP